MARHLLKSDPALKAFYRDETIVQYSIIIITALQSALQMFLLLFYFQITRFVFNLRTMFLTLKTTLFMCKVEYALYFVSWSVQEKLSKNIQMALPGYYRTKTQQTQV